MIKFKPMKITSIREIRPKRFMKLQILRLLRSPGGAKKVAGGFAVGFGLEMVIPITAYVAYLLLIPFVKAVKGSFPAAVIGNLIAKATFLPILLMPAAIKISGHFAKKHHHLITHKQEVLNIITNYQRMFLVMAVFGIILGIIAYYLVYWMYVSFQKKRQLTRREKRDKQNTIVNL